MNEGELREIEALLSAITPEPWGTLYGFGDGNVRREVYVGESIKPGEYKGVLAGDIRSDADMNFIARAPTLVRRLTKEVRRLWAVTK